MCICTAQPSVTTLNERVVQVLHTLTPSEIKIITEYACGKRVEQIALETGKSPGMIRYHLANMRMRFALGVKGEDDWTRVVSYQFGLLMGLLNKEYVNGAE